MDRYATLRNGLVGAWCPSISGSGYTLPDLSPTRANGTLTNMGGQVLYRASGDGLAINFDATNDFVNLPSRTYLPAGRPFSVSWWENIQTATDYSSRIRLISPTNTWLVLRGIGNYGPVAWAQLAGQSAIRASIPTAANSLGVWKHIAIVGFAGPASITASDYAAYENGRSVATSLSGVSFSPVAGSVNRIGFDGVDTATGALMDDIRIYNRAITPQEALWLASKRGIGLAPTRHRRGSLLSQFWLNVAGTWKAAKPWINVGGTWRQGSPKIRAGGAWKG